MIKSMDELLAAGQKGERVRVAVAAADDEAALGAVVLAASLNIADAVLYGSKEKIEAIQNNIQDGSNHNFEIHDVADEQQAAANAVEAVRQGRCQILLKGKIKTAYLLKAVLDGERGLRLDRLLSDVFLFENGNRKENRLMIVTDGGVTLKPDLKQKIEIIENAVFVMHALGYDNPKVALLSAIETVNPGIPSTLEAAVITKMNQRGQIKGCTIDGPLALDNAVSMEAAKTKNIKSPVAGMADILVCPEIESGNILAKSTTYFANFRLAHVIVGATAPVLIPSRADSADSKLLSVALGKIVGKFFSRKNN
jgi:phosphate butyryltransferase